MMGGACPPPSSRAPAVVLRMVHRWRDALKRLPVFGRLLILFQLAFALVAVIGAFTIKDPTARVACESSSVEGQGLTLHG